MNCKLRSALTGDEQQEHVMQTIRQARRDSVQAPSAGRKKMVSAKEAFKRMGTKQRDILREVGLLHTGTMSISDGEVGGLLADIDLDVANILI